MLWIRSILLSLTLLFIAEIADAQTLPPFQWGTGIQRGNAYDLEVDANGNVITAGSFTQTSDFDPGPGVVTLTAGGSVAWKHEGYVRKLDSDGNLLWANSIGGTESDAASSVATDASGNVYVTGAFAGTVDFDPGPGIVNRTAAGMSDAFVQKLDPSGNLIWAVTFGGTDDEDPMEIQVDDAGNVFVTGTFDGTADFEPAA